jgi:prolycopene isomerase
MSRPESERLRAVLARRAPSGAFHREARRDRYDVVVIGAGLAGLAAGALCARAGRAVLVVERHDRPGGYAHGFRRGGRRFDSAIHMIGGAGEGGTIDALLRAVGVRERCELVAVDPIYRAVYPDFEIEAPAGLERFARAHAALFPEQEKTIGRFLEACRGVEREQAELGRADRAPLRAERVPWLRRYRRATLARVLGETVPDAHARAALATLWPYAGLAPSRLSFLYYASTLLSYVEGGAWYCRGTFQRLADALAAALRGHAGELLLRSAVRRIEIDSGRARGVSLENGQRVAADLVISNADARQTVFELAGAEAFPEPYRAALRAGERSTSALVVYAAAAFDPRRAGLAHETFLFDDADPERSAESSAAGQPRWLSITCPTLSDPDLARDGEHLLVLTTLCDPAAELSWRAAKLAHAERMMERAARFVPALGRTLRFAEGATPRTLERYTRNEAGALYGWAHTPRQVGAARLGARTPVPGLLLAGHWTRPGGGVLAVVRSGIDAARSALGADPLDP